MILPKTGGFINGLTGIIYALLLYKKIYNNSDFDDVIMHMINELHLYTIQLSNNLYVITSDFKHVSLNLKEGNLGMIKVLEEAGDSLKWKERNMNDKAVL